MRRFCYAAMLERFDEIVVSVERKLEDGNICCDETNEARARRAPRTDPRDQDYPFLQER